MHNHQDISKRNLFAALTLLVTQIVDDWARPLSEAQEKAMLKKAKLSRLISITSSMCTYIMLLAFTSLQIWNNAQKTSETDLGGLLYPTVFPYDIKKNPNYQITWLGQLAGTILTGICYSTFDTFLAALVLHLCGQLRVLRTSLRDLIGTTRHNNFSKLRINLSLIVNKHEELNRLAFSRTVINHSFIRLTLIARNMNQISRSCYRSSISTSRDCQF